MAVVGLLNIWLTGIAQLDLAVCYALGRGFQAELLYSCCSTSAVTELLYSCRDWAESPEKCRRSGCSSVSYGMRWSCSWALRRTHHDTSGFSLRSARKACLSSLYVPKVSRRVIYFPAKACHESCRGYRQNSSRICRSGLCICTPSSLFKKPLCMRSSLSLLASDIKAFHQDCWLQENCILGFTIHTERAWTTPVQPCALTQPALAPS